MAQQRLDWGKFKQILTIVAPLLIVLACFGIINLLPRFQSSTNAAVTEPTPVAVQEPFPTPPSPTSTVLSGQSHGVTSTPVPAPTETPTAAPTPSPVVAPGVTIRLLGPPDESEFSRQDSITVYWEFPGILPEGTTFVLAIGAQEDEQLLPAGDTPNLGSAFRLRVDLGEVAAEAETVQWRVILLMASGGSPLLESETRTIRVLPAP